MNITNNSNYHFSAQEVAKIHNFIAARTVNAKEVIINQLGGTILVLDSDVRIPFHLTDIFPRGTTAVDYAQCVSRTKRKSCATCFWYIIAGEATPRQRDLAHTIGKSEKGEGICELNDYWTNPTLCRCGGEDYSLK